MTRIGILTNLLTNVLIYFRLFKELAKTNNRKSLQVYTSWLENTIVQKASEPSLLVSNSS